MRWELCLGTLTLRLRCGFVVGDIVMYNKHKPSTCGHKEQRVNA